jgi:hypothetical protein
MARANQRTSISLGTALPKNTNPKSKRAVTIASSIVVAFHQTGPFNEPSVLEVIALARDMPVVDPIL